MSSPSTMTTLTWRASTRPASPRPEEPGPAVSLTVMETGSAIRLPAPRNRSSRRHRNQAASTVSSEQAAQVRFQADSGSPRAIAPLRF